MGWLIVIDPRVVVFIEFVVLVGLHRQHFWELGESFYVGLEAYGKKMKTLGVLMGAYYYCEIFPVSNPKSNSAVQSPSSDPIYPQPN